MRPLLRAVLAAFIVLGISRNVRAEESALAPSPERNEMPIGEPEGKQPDQKPGGETSPGIARFGMPIEQPSVPQSGGLALPAGLRELFLPGGTDETPLSIYGQFLMGYQQI